ncbi:MAG: DUF456 family protein [Verrucomicrobiales bacterium]|nr:DUF456 family protein [Verrucomicrobiales bacterium]
MTGLEILWLAVALILMGIGVLGCVLPGLPGTPLIFAAAVGHRWLVGADTGAPWWVLAILGFLAVVSIGADFLATYYGARTLGATRRGMVGAVLGGVVGLFLGPAGILAGPFVGAFLLEWSGGRAWRDSAKAGAGATVGLLAGAMGKVACSVSMILLFAASVFWRTLAT